jgi:hypothetical protein
LYIGKEDKEAVVPLDDPDQQRKKRNVFGQAAFGIQGEVTDKISGIADSLTTRTIVAAEVRKVGTMNDDLIFPFDKIFGILDIPAIEAGQAGDQVAILTPGLSGIEGDKERNFTVESAAAGLADSDKLDYPQTSSVYAFIVRVEDQAGNLVEVSFLAKVNGSL